MALLTSAPRMANAIADGECLCMTLAQDRFNEFVKMDPRFKDVVMRVRVEKLSFISHHHPVSSLRIALFSLTTFFSYNHFSASLSYLITSLLISYNLFSYNCFSSLAQCLLSTIYICALYKYTVIFTIVKLSIIR